jgi:hypothetical protein
MPIKWIEELIIIVHIQSDIQIINHQLKQGSGSLKIVSHEVIHCSVIEFYFYQRQINIQSLYLFSEDDFLSFVDDFSFVEFN